MNGKNAVLALLACVLVSACGGGGVAGGALADLNNGGSSGTTGGSGNGGGSATTPSAMALQLVDAAGAALATPALSQTAERFIKVTAPNRQANARVELKLDNSLAVLNPASGTMLSNASGEAFFAIAPASLSGNGVVRVTATVAATGGDKSLSLDLQALPARVALTALAVSPATVQVGRTLGVSVRVTVDGVAPAANALSVSFSSTCGTAEPASVSVDAAGSASTTLRTTATGNCAVSASTSGVATPSSATYAVTSAPALLQFVDGSGAALSGRQLSRTADRFLKVTDPNGQANRRVDVTLDNGLAVLTPASGAALTDASGVALLPIAPSSVTASGVVRATATVAAEGGNVIGTLDLQAAPASVVLGAVSVSPLATTVGQSVTASVSVSVDGAPAKANALSVDFSSACGTISPSTVAVDATGKATAVIQTRATGSCSVSAAASGVATAASAAYAVNPLAGATPFALRFVTASPQVIYMKDSVGQRFSQVGFRVVDATGAGVAGQQVTAGLLNAADVNFCGLTPSAISSATGDVTFPVCSGSVPVSVQVRATVAGTGISTDSNLLTVQSGLPSQRFFDLAVTRPNFQVGGWFTDRFNGLSVPITVFAADRQGNPVPNGTPVVFVTEGGQINSSDRSSCILSGGSCTVNLIGQDYRPMGSPLGDPRPGRVTVLAMADGEESFVDLNSNGRYDPGEPIEDLGRPFLDKDDDGVFTAAYTNLVSGTSDGDAAYPMAAGTEGTLACDSPANRGLSVAGTCNGEWNGSGLKPDGITAYLPTKVRRRIQLVFSGSTIGHPGAQKQGTCAHSVGRGYDASIPASTRTELLGCSNTGIVLRLADYNGNPLPADATLAVAVRKLDAAGTCTATLNGGTVIGNTTEPTLHLITLNGCAVGDFIDLTVTAPAGNVASTFTVTVP